MILRLFVALLILNTVAFVVRAEAGEREALPTEIYNGNPSEIQDRMSGDFIYDDEDALLDLGSRLLSWRLSDSADRHGRRFASESAQPDHSIALINEGAALNLRWNF
ncbi:MULTISPECIES: hypothetical protein [Marinobacter]|uniref:Uncharacterized protein n=1 Tax=Marinobacter segnicrescens TaxID=430453 RepID=A0A1I0B3D0_9GAMM|nr:MULTISPECIES: hypothetical protein [Marinobacter]UZD66945.1 hypothetical protein LJ360_06355 [Marinobacter sp. AN1]SET01224.1 hypothetical protein SAMN04487962_103216 [Marinobacter segnicrescens]